MKVINNVMRRGHPVSMVSEWVFICAAGDIAVDEVRRFEVNGLTLAIANAGGDFYALDDNCTHAKAALSDGFLNSEEGIIECPFHGGAFYLKTGAAARRPCSRAVRTYRTLIRDNEVFVKISDSLT